MEETGKGSSVSLTEDQAEVLAFLQNAKTFALDAPAIRIDTHGACVFLAGGDVYKIKRAVRYPYLDFSTLEKRHAACLAEIAVNKDNAPSIYLGVVPIMRRDGVLHIGGEGDIVEWVVHLRRFDENTTLDKLAEQGELGPGLMDRLAQGILAAHARAPRCERHGVTADLLAVLEETVTELQEAEDVFPQPAVSAFAAQAGTVFENVSSLLVARAEKGAVRRCHGDLHLGNIALIDGEPILFDAIEFDDRIATCDILYDLAFVLMDLWERGLCSDANRLLNRYLALSDDPDSQIEGLEALPLFLALRAAIRAKVCVTRSHLDSPGQAFRAKAQAYFDLAAGFLRGEPPCLVAVGGLSGSGKTALSAAMAPHLGRPPGALHLRSDLVRKRLFSADETTRLGSLAYTGSVSAHIYARLREQARKAIRAGQSVIVDATYQNTHERLAVSALAEELGVPFTGFWLDAPAEVLKSRIEHRVGDASDATAAVLSAQIQAGTDNLDWVRLNADQPIDRLVKQALQFTPAELAG